MPLVSVPGVYDGKEIRLLEPSPVQGRYRVLVTFVEPAQGRTKNSTFRIGSRIAFVKARFYTTRAVGIPTQISHL
jgi:hypothetical protein